MISISVICGGPAVLYDTPGKVEFKLEMKHCKENGLEFRVGYRQHDTVVIFFSFFCS